MSSSPFTLMRLSIPSHAVPQNASQKRLVTAAQFNVLRARETTHFGARELAKPDCVWWSRATRVQAVGCMQRMVSVEPWKNRLTAIDFFGGKF